MSSYNGLGGGDLDRLQRDLRDLRSTVDDLEQLPRDLRELRSEMEDTEGSLRRRIDDVESEVESAQEDLAEAEKTLSSLARRVEWLERRARSADGAQVVNLDGRDAKLRGLILDVGAGRAARQDLLAEHERSQLVRLVDQYNRSYAAYRVALGDVLGASETLSSTGLDDPEHQAAGTAFNQALQRTDSAGQNALALKEQAADAKRTLAADNDRRGDVDDVLESADTSERQLALRLRNRITKAVADAAVLPVWFTTAFGPLLPARNPEAWLADAVKVPLGPGPGPHASQQQIQDRKDAEQALRRR